MNNKKKEQKTTKIYDTKQTDVYLKNSPSFEFDIIIFLVTASFRGNTQRRTTASQNLQPPAMEKTHLTGLNS